MKKFIAVTAALLICLSLLAGLNKAYAANPISASNAELTEPSDPEPAETYGPQVEYD